MKTHDRNSVNPESPSSKRILGGRRRAAPQATAVCRQNQPRWHLLYFVLAGFDLITVSAGLYLGHHVRGMYRRSVDVNHAWVVRSHRYSDLGRFAAAVNAPGNEVFDTLDTEGESKRLESAAARFLEELEAARQDLESLLETNGPLARDLLAGLGDVDVAMDEMVAAAETIFTLFEAGRREEAGTFMATMDRRYGRAVSILAELRERFGNEQMRYLEQQLAAAEALVRYERAIAAAIIVMVGGIAWYGHKLSRSVQEVNRQLLEVSRRAGMAEIATGVLHNVGNVLNSVNVSAELVVEKVGRSKLPGLAKASDLMREHARDLGAFMSEDERGRKLPDYLGRLAEHLASEQAATLEELRSLTRNIQHIKDIVSTQQSYAGVSGVIESVSVRDLLEDTLNLDLASPRRRGIRIVRHYEETPPIAVDKYKVLQILTNLVKNATHALHERGGHDARLTLRTRRIEGNRIQIQVADNGVGIPQENLTRIFSHGFTTKADGHGFGLHGSALAAKTMGGSLTAHSDGRDRGATFTLELPLKPAEVKR